MSEPLKSGQNTAERLGLRYQDLLRTIGAGLDQDAADRIALMEVDDGFLVRRERFRQTHLEASVSHYTHDLLKEGLKNMRGQPRPRPPRRTFLWSDFSHTYEDFFRALGYELDQAGARSFLLDERQTGLWLSYACGDAEGGIRQIILGEADIEEILNEAIRRRSVAVKGPPSQQLGVNLAAPTLTSFVQTKTNWIPVVDNRPTPYQKVLRSIGARLDELDAERVSVLEGPGLFGVRYDVPGGGRLQWRWVVNEEIEADRSPMRQKSTRRHPAEPRPSGRYEDLLRALGYQLEVERVSELLIDFETEDLIVTYSDLDPERSVTQMRHTLTLRPSEQIALCDAAHGRRVSSKPTFLSRLSHRG